MAMQFEEFESFNGALPAAPDAMSALERLQYLIDNTPAIMYCSVPSGDFKMTFVSSNAFNVLGYRPEQMVADPNFWFDHIHPDDAPAIFSSLAQVFVEGERAYEYRFRAADGHYLWMHDNLRLVRDAHGTPLEVMGSLTDITDRKLMEQALHSKGEEQQQLIARLQAAHDQLLQAEKMASIGQLAAGIAHEINNPVGFVNSNMGTLQRYLATLCNVVHEYDAVDRGPSGGAGTGAADGADRQAGRPRLPGRGRHRAGAGIDGRPQARQGHRAVAEGLFPHGCVGVAAGRPARGHRQHLEYRGQRDQVQGHGRQALRPAAAGAVPGVATEPGVHEPAGQCRPRHRRARRDHHPHGRATATGCGWPSATAAAALRRNC